MNGGTRLWVLGVLAVSCLAAYGLAAQEAASVEIRSLDDAECGIDVVFVTAKRFGKDMSIQDVRRCFPADVPRRGSTIDDIKRGLEACGLPHKELFGNIGAVKKWLDAGAAVLIPMPDRSHVVVCLGLKDGKILVYDPPSSTSWVPQEGLESHWAGYGIAVSPDCERLNLGTGGVFGCRRPILAWVALGVSLLACGVAVLLLRRSRTARGSNAAG
jgi:hypothetical protein